LQAPRGAGEGSAARHPEDIRLQLGSRGSPVVGDRKYGSKLPFPAGIALHSRRLTLTHPVKKTTLQIEAPLPDSWGKVKEW